MSSKNEKPASRAGAVGPMNVNGERLRAAAKYLEFDRDPGQQRQHHACRDHADGRLHRGAAYQPDAVGQGSQVADVECRLFTIEGSNPAGGGTVSQAKLGKAYQLNLLAFLTSKSLIFLSPKFVPNRIFSK